VGLVWGGLRILYFRVDLRCGCRQSSRLIGYDVGMNDAPAKRRPRWFRFSLRMLLVIVTVLCVWLGVKVNAARRQKAAVEAFLKAGGSFSYDYETVQVRVDPDRLAGVPNAVPPEPQWMRVCFGDDLFHSVVEFILVSHEISQADFSKLNGAPDVWYLIFTDLKIIDSSGNARPIGDDELKIIGRLAQLRRLILCKCDVHASGLESLVSLRHLRDLDLNGSRADDLAVEPIGRMKSLKVLRLAGTQITDAGLKKLHDLSKVGFLDLVDTAVSDASLNELKGFTKLANLDLRGTHVSSAGIRELQEALPTCTIKGP
jgi:hypothetical protein